MHLFILQHIGRTPFLLFNSENGLWIFDTKLQEIWNKNVQRPQDNTGMETLKLEWKHWSSHKTLLKKCNEILKGQDQTIESIVW